jgi:hypothetical protein
MKGSHFPINGFFGPVLEGSSIDNGKSPGLTSDIWFGAVFFPKKLLRISFIADT